MTSATKEVAIELLPLIRVYKDSSVERLKGTPIVPPSPDQDPETGVSSKDVTISEDPSISARLYLPKLTSHNQNQKFPILVFFHGGGFCIESVFSSLYHCYLGNLVSQINVAVVSVEYRLAPEHPLPAAYEDCWAALQWVASQSAGNDKDPWLTNSGDFERIFIGGDSAGGNIVHNIAMRAGVDSLPCGVKVLGAYLVHPYFWSSKPIGSESKEVHEKSLPSLVWNFVYPSVTGGVDNPMINPEGPGAPNLARLGCDWLLVCLAGKDLIRDRGVWYVDMVRKSGWKGEIELFEVEGEDHVFHIFNIETENAKAMAKRMASFIFHDIFKNAAMTSATKEVAIELLPLIRVYKDGSVERLEGTPIVPPSPDQDPETGVSSKDVTISEDPSISARLYLPKLTSHNQNQKFPILVFFHGGGFCIESAFSSLYHCYLGNLVSQINVAVVSVEYRLAPEHPLPAAYEDCWAALQWVASQSAGNDKDPWLTNSGDFERIFIGGDSAGGNIVHNIAMRAGVESLPCGVKVLGAYLVHPYFWSSKPIGSESKEVHEKSLPSLVWNFVYPSVTGGVDNPMINPEGPGAPSLAGLGCDRLLVCVAGKDLLRDRGVWYVDMVRKSGWKGEIELFEVEGEDHVFHIFNIETENAKAMAKRLASFIFK
ncbi:tuliposide B-converting enzyme 1, amyloplastic-like [Quercus robur]|uniref:tuliposide B-converting enzyme 1, amyloplastic-like n=1 Tax=Quercus robur TaxID=38942 RepID=UPI00216140EA|nr:tuliposide B-converting enzyme 1, amyloplastic-like [Quercus robur]